MPSFKTRSKEKELLDEEHIPRDQLFRNLRELELVNIWLGGLAISKAGFKKALEISANGPRFKLADIGCGGGDAIRYLAKFAGRKGIEGQFVGIDLKSDCIDYAEDASQGMDKIDFVEGDYRDVIRRDKEITHIHAALFCHHLTDDELVELFRFCKDEKKTLIVNDLQRHPLAYYSIWGITRLLGGSKLVKNDAPLSVLRGFRKRELQSLLARAGVKNYHLRWKWAFRYMIVIPA